MTRLAEDPLPREVVAEPSRLAAGLVFAVISAGTFGMSGALARPLLDAGWSAGAIVLVRVLIGAVVLLPAALVALRGRWRALRRNAGMILVYGAVAVAGTQFCYFSAVQYMQVGPALLIEYTAPVAVVAWQWVRHGQRPGPLTVVGAGVAAVGLVLVLDLLSGADLDPAGVLWALAAMIGAAMYFVMSADGDNGLPPIALASGGLLVGAAALGLAGLVGVLPMHTAHDAVTYAGSTVDWWVPMVLLGVVTAAAPYATGIAASRRLGSRLASFVALLEVVSAVLWAWLLLDQLPRAVQLAGGLLILAGVVVVKLGERATARPAGAPTPPG
ncbi:EamA family transporter [Nocardioides mangrovi]|uniref:DMT family transporter n=1 Tax=Nocardioides mangrovi TaxID=2874580 RepID=A0ABS7U6M1_9ACTN|nr:EamA family transporter [Nocardioides mangrovi]MBZ5736628.1 DMT family transporter [Nocardioides mangrovi]